MGVREAVAAVLAWNEERTGMPMIVHDFDRWGPDERRAYRDYLAAHQYLDERPEAVPIELLEVSAQALGSPGADAEAKKRALVALAHHRSRRACELIRRYLERPDPELNGFA